MEQFVEQTIELVSTIASKETHSASVVRRGENVVIIFFVISAL